MHPGPRRLPVHPANGQTAADTRHQLVRDHPQFGLTQGLTRTFVFGQRDLILIESGFLAGLPCRTDILCKLYQLLKNLYRLDLDCVPV